MGADSIHKQAGVFTEVLTKQTRDYWRLYSRNDHSILPAIPLLTCSASHSHWSVEFLYQEVQKPSGTDIWKSGYTGLFKFLPVDCAALSKHQDLPIFLPEFVVLSSAEGDLWGLELIQHLEDLFGIGAVNELKVSERRRKKHYRERLWPKKKTIKKSSRKWCYWHQNSKLLFLHCHSLGWHTGNPPPPTAWVTAMIPATQHQRRQKIHVCEVRLSFCGSHLSHLSGSYQNHSFLLPHCFPASISVYMQILTKA